MQFMKNKNELKTVWWKHASIVNNIMRTVKEEHSWNKNETKCSTMKKYYLTRCSIIKKHIEE